MLALMWTAPARPRGAFVHLPQGAMPLIWGLRAIATARGGVGAKGLRPETASVPREVWSGVAAVASLCRTLTRFSALRMSVCYSRVW